VDFFTFNTTDVIPDETSRLGELYHENSKLRPRASAHLGRWIGDLSKSPYSLSTLSRGYKTYPQAARVTLPAPTQTRALPISDVISARRSIVTSVASRKFGERPLAASDLARLLVDGYGITGEHCVNLHGVDIVQPLRASPSGGALYPLEIYPLVVQEGEIEQGLYHFNVVGNQIEALRRPVELAEIERITSYPAAMTEAALIIVITAVFGRSYFKYQERGYRFVLLEAGHVAEHFYLVGTALGLSVVAIGGFFDDEVNGLVGVNGVDEAAVYVIAIGHPFEMP